MRSIAALLLGLCAVAGLAHAETNFEKKVAVDPRGVVDISNVAGKIEVSAWDNPEVEVRGEIGAGVDKVDVSTDRGRTSIRRSAPSWLRRTARAG